VSRKLKGGEGTGDEKTGKKGFPVGRTGEGDECGGQEQEGRGDKEKAWSGQIREGRRGYLTSIKRGSIDIESDFSVKPWTSHC